MAQMVDASPREDSRDGTLLLVAELHALAGDFDEAFCIVDRVSDERKSGMLARIADVAGSANSPFLQPPRELTPAEIESRLRVVRRIVAASPKVPFQVPMALADLGRFEEALTFAHTINAAEAEASPTLPWALCRIGSAQAKAGQTDAARKTFREAPDVIERHPAMAAGLDLVAHAQARAGDVAGALKTAEMTGPGNKTRVLISIAEMQATRGDRAGANGTLGRALEDAEFALAHPPAPRPRAGGRAATFWTSHWLYEIATIEALQGKFPDALESARTIPQERRGQAYAVVAEQQARAGGAADVLAWARKLERASDRAWAMRGLAEGVASNEQETGSVDDK
jgi:hypothetical protein